MTGGVLAAFGVWAGQYDMAIIAGVALVALGAVIMHRRSSKALGRIDEERR
ncbi:MAG: hypothetical protein ACRDWS_01475 [Acidimicrobiia bacterium]